MPTGHFTCQHCGKQTYLSRKEAKRVAKTVHPGEDLNAYRCPHGEGWHIGHLPKAVVNGDFSRAILRPKPIK
jgi:hypothetical protein